jgi:hypothetical protein
MINLLKKFLVVFVILFSCFQVNAEDTSSGTNTQPDPIVQTELFLLKSSETEIISFSKIKLVFSELLENDLNASREFRIISKADEFDEFFVIKTELDSADNSKIFLTLDRDTEKNGEYELTVIDIKSKTGKNIES